MNSIFQRRIIMKESYYDSVQRKKGEKFIELATARTEKAISVIRLIGNLANTSNYNYSKESAEKMFTAIEEAIDDAKLKFKLIEKKRFTL